MLFLLWRPCTFFLCCGGLARFFLAVEALRVLFFCHEGLVLFLAVEALHVLFFAVEAFFWLWRPCTFFCCGGLARLLFFAVEAVRAVFVAAEAPFFLLWRPCVCLCARQRHGHLRDLGSGQNGYNETS